MTEQEKILPPIFPTLSELDQKIILSKINDVLKKSKNNNAYYSVMKIIQDADNVGVFNHIKYNEEVNY